MTSYQLALENLLSTTSTNQVNIDTLKPFTKYHDNGGLSFNLNFFASMHFIIIIGDNVQFYFEQLKNVLETIEALIMYFLVLLEILYGFI